jgi:hypothetical protein
VTLLGRRRAPDVSGRLQRRLARRFLDAALPGPTGWSAATSAIHALWQYEQERLPFDRADRPHEPRRRTRGRDRRGRGPRARTGFTDVNAVLSFEERKAIVRGYAGAAGFAQSQVNKSQNNRPDNHPGRAA